MATQYGGASHRKLLRDYKIIPSMSGKANLAKAGFVTSRAIAKQDRPEGRLFTDAWTRIG